MILSDILGAYTIAGTNQDAENTPYKGTLTLKENAFGKIDAIWCIAKDQYQYGKGFFKNNILVIHFYYTTESQAKKYKGIVVYKCITPFYLEGFWSEKHADQHFLGTEICTRIPDNTFNN